MTHVKTAVLLLAIGASTSLRTASALQPWAIRHHYSQETANRVLGDGW